jgi:hypothetical protein
MLERIAAPEGNVAVPTGRLGTDGAVWWVEELRRRFPGGEFTP